MLTEEERIERKRARDRNYYKANAEKLREKQKRYARRNKEAISKKASEYYQRNKDAILEYHKAYREKNRVELREKEMLRRYGISRQEFKELVAKQGGKCSICGDETDLVIDHKHDGTQNVRGLVCNRCNVGLGMFREDRTILLAAIEYIER